MSLSKEQILSINGLAVSDFISEASDIQLEDYCKDLTAFVENFPTQETALKNSFSANDYSTFSATLLGVVDILKKIKASNMEQSCIKLLGELGGQKYSIVEAHLSYFLAEVSGLSIDIQMAQRGCVAHHVPRVILDPAPKPKFILGVDDVSLILLGLKTVLQNTEYKFTGVNSGEAALRYIEKFTTDLFILDIEMPGMNGYELMKKLRERGQRAPVIFLTGNASKEYVRKALELGAADFIVKPINKEHVLEKIKKQIG